MNQGPRIMLPNGQFATEEQIAMLELQAREQAARQQANNQIAFARAAMAASAAGSVISMLGSVDDDGQRESIMALPASIVTNDDIDHAVDIGFRIADRCLKRIGLNIEEAKPKEVVT